MPTMAVLPLLLTTWWTDLGYPPMNENFDLTAQPQPGELLRAFDRSYPFVYDRGVLDFYKPWLNLDQNVGRSSITVDDDTFKIVADVQQFKPEEVSVKIVNRFLVVEAKHEEKQEHDSISRQFVQKYLLPNCADVDQLKSTISSDGILTITAPLKPEEPKDERVIKIDFIGQPTLRPSEDENRTEASTTEANTTTEKTVEDNEVREEVTTQAQQETAKPEK
ncbi:protein lethal(2)essential for life-like [Linepithema humile]|uniref:protein lethal(2)essential for life-like n=1 Tax=Linepithema humile TaxID=83485 RepID=UPI00351EDD29